MPDKFYLGVDIGTYETKGVLVNLEGKVITQSAKKHQLLVPQQGWAEHRPIEDWWNDFVFICLPTPMNSDGSCHIDIVESVLTDFNYISTLGNNYCKLFIIKSTVPPGTTKGWNEKLSNIDIVFNPEFLTEANSVEDYKNQNRIILGGENGWNNSSLVDYSIDSCSVCAIGEAALLKNMGFHQIKRQFNFII